MRPAFSVIFFTTVSGAGYGLLVLICLLYWFGAAPMGSGFSAGGLGLAFVFISAGLLSSTLHLKHPERAWRALSQWRSSWLSREGVFAIATYGPFLLLAYGWTVLGSDGILFKLAALVTMVLSLVTVNCTAMIYASLKSIDAWSQPLVPRVYFAFALQLGSLWLAVILSFNGFYHFVDGIIALAASGLVWFFKRQYWSAIDGLSPKTTANTATGLAGTVSAFSAPHTEENFLTHEMGFKIARKHSATLRRIAVMLGLAAPAILVLLSFPASGAVQSALLLLAAVSAMAGAFVERWLFFAEAKHTMAVYYG